MKVAYKGGVISNNILKFYETFDLIKFLQLAYVNKHVLLVWVCKTVCSMNIAKFVIILLCYSHIYQNFIKKVTELSILDIAIL